jgi:spore germination protein KC
MHNVKQKARLLLLLLLLSLSVTGCWDWQELESLGLVQALGLELEPDQKDITVTTMIAIPKKLGAAGGQAGGDEESGVVVVAAKAPSIYEAFNLINTSINREITLRQNQILVIGESMAKAGMSKWIDNLVRFREMRRTLLLFVCRGPIAAIFNVQPKLEQNPAEYLSDLVNLSGKTAMYPRMMLNDFMEHYEAYAQANTAPLIAPAATSPQKTSAPAKSAGGAPPEASQPGPTELRIIGAAVFNSDKLVGNLNNYETQVLQLLTNHFDEALLTVADPQRSTKFIGLRLLKNGPATRIKYRRQSGRDTFNVQIHLEAELLSIQSEIDYTSPHLETVLSRHIARVVKNRVDAVIAKTQRQFHADIFGFGVKVRNTMLTSKEWENYRWPAKFPQAQIRTRVNIAIRRAGVQFKPPQLRR